MFLLGGDIQWIVSDNGRSSQQSLPRIRLYHCSFSDVYSIAFRLSGLMSLIRCEFKGRPEVRLILEKSRYESEITRKTLRHFKSRDDHNRIEIIQTKIYGIDLYISINNAARRLKMENVDLNSDLYISIGEEGHDCQTVSLLELEMINCRVSGQIRPYLTFSNSFAKFRFESTVFDRISLSSRQQAGLASYVFDNCTFTKALGVDIQKFLDFKILQSTFNVPYDCDGTECYVHLTGVDGYNLMSDRELSEIFFNRSIVYYFHSIVDIESTSFQGGHSPFFTVRQAELTLSKTVFHIQTHRTRPENLIDIQDYFTLKDVLINFTSTNRDLQQVNIMSIVTKSIEYENTQIICPLGMAAVETLPITESEPLVYRCQAVCTSNMYTFQSGNMTLDGHYEYYGSLKSVVSNLNNPLCNRCPVGAKCSGDIKALPNYWGYRNKDTVVMIRCPTGYCCQDDESCQSFDSCNSNRSGPLCGVCEKGLAESLFDQTCIPLEKCHTWLIVLLYISCAVGYGFGLMLIDNVKEAVISSLKKIYQCIKVTVLKKVKPNQNSGRSKKSGKSKSSEKEVKRRRKF